MNKGYFYSDEQVLEEARILAHTPGASTYTVAAQLDRPQATVWWHVTHRLPELDIDLSIQVKAVLRKNHRGGGQIKSRGGLRALQEFYYGQNPSLEI